MGFGSYDEFERREQSVEDADAAVSVHENDHVGEMTVASDVSTDALVGQLEEIEGREG